MTVLEAGRRRARRRRRLRSWLAGPVTAPRWLIAALVANTVLHILEHL